ncbi:MAG: efflux RND transporter periplasmic adaptor subunit [Rhodoferax sp.]|nr:efflux RND transporter periplasmic adaptor subunit [Rhodoferax sp.]
MALRAIHSVVAVVGIAAASAGAWWYQSRPQGPTEVAAPTGPARSGAAAPATAAGGGGAGPAAPRAAGVEVAKAERARLQDDAQSVGTLRSRQSVMLRPEVAGRVREIGFADGATVRKGQVLVQLDDTLQRAEIKQAQAQVSIAQANLKRNQELVAQSFVAQRVLDESNANLQVAEAQLALACARWSRMAILAPFDGTVGIRNVNLGDYVKDGADLVNLEDISSMYADFRLPERFQGKLKPRQSVQLQLDAFPGRMFKATVEAIDPLLDVNGRSVGVRAVLPNTMGEPLAQRGGRRVGRRRRGAAGHGGRRPARVRRRGLPGRGPGHRRVVPAAAATPRSWRNRRLPPQPVGRMNRRRVPVCARARRRRHWSPVGRPAARAAARGVALRHCVPACLPA